MKFFDFDAEKVPESIEIFDVSRETNKYADGKGPVGKWPENYVGVESITAGPYTIDLIKKTNGEHALAISSVIGEDEILGYQSISLNVIEKIVEDNKVKNIPVDYYPKVRKIVDNLTHVGASMRSGTSFPCMLVGGGEALVLNGYNSPFIPPPPDRSEKDAEAEVLEAKGEQPA